MKKILYFVDPLCAWCYGFMNVMQQVYNTSNISIHLVPGGISTNSHTPMTARDRENLKRTWKSVNDMTGINFDYTLHFASDKFVLNSAPVCQALVAVQHLRPKQVFNFLHKIQLEFFEMGIDVTRINVLTDIAGLIGISSEEFTACYNSSAIINLTREGFSARYQMGVKGYPSLIGVTDSEVIELSTGFRKYPAVIASIQNWKN